MNSILAYTYLLCWVGVSLCFHHYFTDRCIHHTSNVFVIGLIVPRTEQLFTFNSSSEGVNSVSVSPFVAGTGGITWLLLVYTTHTPSAAKLLAIRGLDHVLNSIALIFVLSAANTDLYISSRTLYGLALEGKAPVVFKRVNRFGVPYTALGASVAVTCFAFLSIGKGSGKVLEYLSNLCSTFGAITWSECGPNIEIEILKPM